MLQNNFIALRKIDPNDRGGLLYVEYQNGSQADADIAFDRVDFVELYNQSVDPWSLNNLAKTAPAELVRALHDELHAWYACAGDACP